MRSNDPFRALWRKVSGPAPASDIALDRLAARISMDASLALRVHGRFPRAALWVSIAAVAVIAVAIGIMPTQRPATLLGAISGGEAPARTFEVATVGPRDGAWLIAAAIGADR
ncbi:MAG TPA: hypothetical protein VFA43_21470 [Gemmatimonadaceae bacterium]|nr:hypothetical protein [Gemmatimonadaceae bacterium]